MTKFQRNILRTMERGATLEHQHHHQRNILVLVSKTREQIIQLPTFRLLKGKGWVHTTRTKNTFDGPVDVYTITATGKADAKDGGGL